MLLADTICSDEEALDSDQIFNISEIPLDERTNEREKDEEKMMDKLLRGVQKGSPMRHYHKYMDGCDCLENYGKGCDNECRRTLDVSYTRMDQTQSTRHHRAMICEFYAPKKVTKDTVYVLNKLKADAEGRKRKMKPLCC